MKLSIASKLGVGFGFVLILLITGSAFAVVGQMRVAAASEELVRLQEFIEAADQLGTSALKARVGLDNYIFLGEAEGKKDIEEAHDELDAMWAVVQPYLAGGPPGAEQFVGNAHATYARLIDDALNTYEANPNDRAAATAKLEDLDEFFEKTFQPALEQQRERAEIHRQEVIAAVRDEFTTAVQAVIATGAAALIVGMAAAYTISRGITRSAAHLSAAARSISLGDLDVPIEVKTGDEMEVLGESIERMRTSLKAAIQRLQRRRAAV